MNPSSPQTPCCPGCGRPVRPGRERCVWCGVDISSLAQPETHPLCPVCRSELTKHVSANWTVHLCGQGHGIWMTAPVLERFERFHESVRPQGRKSAKANGADASESNEREGVSLSNPHPPVLPEGVQDTTVEYRPCPECGQAMARRAYKKISGVIVDACLGHGVWFDAGEFERVAQFLRAGGIEASRRFEALSAARRERLMRDLGFFRHLPKYGSHFF